MPRYLEKNQYLPIEKLEKRCTYIGIGRNFHVGVWTGTGFMGVRNKYGKYFGDEEIHYDEDDHHGTFQPLRKIEHPLITKDYSTEA